MSHKLNILHNKHIIFLIYYSYMFIIFLIGVCLLWEHISGVIYRLVVEMCCTSAWWNIPFGRMSHLESFFNYSYAVLLFWKKRPRCKAVQWWWRVIKAHMNKTELNWIVLLRAVSCWQKESINNLFDWKVLEVVGFHSSLYFIVLEWGQNNALVSLLW